VLVHSILNVEHGGYASDEKVQGAESKVFTGTVPENHQSSYHTSGGMRAVSYRLPAPKTLSSGLNTVGLIFPSLRNLSGLKASGSG